MKMFLAALAVSTALTGPGFAHAASVTMTTTLNNYYGPDAYLAYYLTDPNGNYAGSLWLSGRKARYYGSLIGWARATRGDLSEVNGLTGASVGSGRTMSVTVDIADALFDAGYQLHVDAAAENMPSSPNEIVVPLTSAGSGQTVPGRHYIADFSYSK
ncbi:DUF2271 domain-containing protein [Martelella alba]|uniref:DUF2271 domain-containing protein n=1 Tax=Martelella alba TaxID=2590451 RepID=A0A506UJ68_9HYPH|nr:DUF2271 domain-containing protein [Martelella alba]TPW33371.1 DUF2271 domain-containing protein [Martelella alba]